MAGPVPAVTIKVRSLVFGAVPVAVPVIVTVYVPADKVFELFRFTTLLFPGITGFVPKLIFVPAGTPADAVSVIGLVNPPNVVVPSVIDIVAGAGQFAVTGAGDVKSNPCGGGAEAKGLSQTPRPYVATLITPATF